VSILVPKCVCVCECSSMKIIKRDSVLFCCPLTTTHYATIFSSFDKNWQKERNFLSNATNGYLWLLEWNQYVFHLLQKLKEKQFVGNIFCKIAEKPFFKMSEYKKIYRLLIVSSRSRNKIAISGSVLNNVIKLEYDYETSTLSDLVILGTRGKTGSTMWKLCQP
jgi:hypothetical protein